MVGKNFFENEIKNKIIINEIILGNEKP